MTTRIWRVVLAACVCLTLGGDPTDILNGEERQGASVVGSPQGAKGAVPQDSGHPLASTLQWVRQEIADIEKSVTDYSATIISRERVDGKLGEYETVFVKIRHRPVSIYAYIVGPDSRKGNEAIYVEGKNNNSVLVHTTGVFGKLFGTLALDPVSPMAMKDRRHPITELGMLNMCRGLIRFLESDLSHAEGQVRIVAGARVNQRSCTCIEISHPVRREHFRFHRVRVFVDDELKLPIRYEQYDWPKQAGAAPELVEEYTYLNIKLNNGFNDADFDPRNPGYAFP